MAPNLEIILHLGVFFPFSVSGLFRTQFSRRRAKKLTLVEN